MERLALEAQQQKHNNDALDSSMESEKGKGDKSHQNRPKKHSKSERNPNLNTSLDKEEKKSKKKGQKLYCVCRTPYDKSK